jgi:hypothetical protein
MELDDFKTTWQALDLKVEQQRTLSLQGSREGKLQNARRGLWPLLWGQVAQIVAGMCLMVLFGPIWVAHRGTLHLMAPALLMHAYGLMFVLFAARTLALIGRIDYGAPVIQIQRRLAELRRWRTRVEWPLFGIVGCFIWIPMMLVMFNALGADIWILHRKIVYWDIVVGFACLSIPYGLVQRARRNGGDTGGNSIQNVQEDLDRIARFEDE